MKVDIAPLRGWRSRIFDRAPRPAAPGELSSLVAPAAAAPGPDEASRILRRTRVRLMAVSGLVTLAILVVLGFAVYASVARVQDDELNQRMSERAEQGTGLVSVLGPAARGRGPGFGREDSNMAMAIVQPGPAFSSGGTFTINGVETGDLPNRQSVTAARNGRQDVRDVVVMGTPLRVLSVPASFSGQTFVVQVVADRTQQAQLLSTLQDVLLAGGLVALLAALAAGYLYAGRALVPIRASLVRQREALQRQREFTANASHELRTPLTVIRASVEDLRRNRGRPVSDVGEALSDIDAEVGHLTALVEDLLLLARTDSGAVQMERLPLDLADVAAEAASALVPLADDRAVRIVLDPLPAPVVGDPLRLRQLVTILVDNAIRHGGRGSEVAVHVKADGESALLGVEDEGPGIPPEDLTRVFERFWRGDRAPAGGTGLGLAIAKWIVEQHGGWIVASNRPEGGARFLVRLPVGDALPAVGDDEAEHAELPDRRSAAG